MKEFFNLLVFAKISGNCLADLSQLVIKSQQFKYIKGVVNVWFIYGGCSMTTSIFSVTKP